MTNVGYKQIKILLVEDNLGEAFLVKDKLIQASKIQFSVAHVERIVEAINYLQSKTFDIILLDLNLPDSNGLETFSVLNTVAPQLPIILLTGLNDEALSLQAVREGAQDYLLKENTTTEMLVRSINYAIERKYHLEKISQRELRLQEINQKLIKQVKENNYELEKQNKELKKLFNQAIIDRITRVANRHYFEDFLSREWANAIRNRLSISIIMIDIDHFKTFNDTYGHQMGDYCLYQVAQSIRKVIKRPKDIVARYGGEEFIVILLNIDLTGTLTVAENIHETVRNLSIVDQSRNIKISVTISLGISSIRPSPQTKAAQLINAADKALYLAKQKGRDQIEMCQL